ncbi:hypothetical protein AVEN_180591-1 [Araneus ventricosus]|uniref:Uncharacterized protein n=1 Tax=Araneus ventricosus TaxID=182803 RepID=A0A4Y2UL03_ARAVE|nr:hypothetical protein AVEN_180591-1 [Araneus ventricosus]
MNRALKKEWRVSSPSGKKKWNSTWKDLFRSPLVKKTEIRGKLDASIECGSRKFHHRIYKDITVIPEFRPDFLPKIQLIADLEKNEMRGGRGNSTVSFRDGQVRGDDNEHDEHLNNKLKSFWNKETYRIREPAVDIVARPKNFASYQTLPSNLGESSNHFNG